MSGTLNKVILIGNLGDNVKTHYFENGGCIARFPIATHESYTQKKTGEKVTQTQWHQIVVKNKLAEICEKYLKKGDKIYCEGKIRTSEYEVNNTSKLKVEIHASEINFLSPKSENTPQNKTKEHFNSKGIIEDLPF